jgi:hypothetical protein
VRAVYADQLGVELPEHSDVSIDDLMAIARRMAVERCKWNEVPYPQQFDVVLMTRIAGRRAPTHVGVMLNETLLMHSERGTACVIVPLSLPTIRNRIMGFYRYAAGAFGPDRLSGNAS